jgi:hypothetical protein
LDKSGPHPKTDARKSRWSYDVGMNTSRFRPKRELSPLQRARLSLGLKVDAEPKTNLAWLLRKAVLGKTAVDYLRFSDDEQARQIVALYDSLNATERKAVTIDYLIMAAGADVHHVSGVIQEAVSRIRGVEAGLLAYMDAPKVMKKTVEHALTPDGYQDRRLILETVGVASLLRQTSVTSRPRV